MLYNNPGRLGTADAASRIQDVENLPLCDLDSMQLEKSFFDFVKLPYKDFE